jgi:hypothetical protein
MTVDVLHGDPKLQDEASALAQSDPSAASSDVPGDVSAIQPGQEVVLKGKGGERRFIVKAVISVPSK